jgi:hypothetical protein
MPSSQPGARGPVNSIEVSWEYETMIKQQTRTGKLASLSGAAFILLLVAVICNPLGAQSSGQKKPAPATAPEAAAAEATAKAEKALTTQQQRAVYLLEQLLEKSKDFDNEGLKIRIRVRVADSLWDYDAPRARQMFEDAFHAIDALHAGDSARDKAANTTQSQLRNEIIRLISARDSELADKLIKTVADDSEKKDSDPLSFAASNNRATLYLQSAMLLVNSDPGRASQMLRVGIDSGLIGEQLYVALDAFRRKDLSLGDELFRYALLKSKSDPQYPALKIIVLAYYLFPDFGQPGGSGAASPSLGLVPQFLNFAYAAFMQAGNQAQPAVSETSQMAKADVRPQMDYWAIQSLLPYFDRYMPDKGLALRSQLTRAGSKIVGEQLDMIDSFSRPGVVQDLLSKAMKALGPERDELYAQAALLASQKGDFEQSLSIVKSISDEQRKTGLETGVRLQGVTDAIGKADYETAYRYAKDVPRLQQRIYAFGQLSTALFDKKDRQRALEVLSDAEALTSRAENGPDKARAMLTLAGAVAHIDGIRGFETMKSAINAINRTSLTLTPAGYLTVGGRGAGPLNTFNFNDAFTPLALSDFEGALLLAQSLERKEAAVLAQVAICRSALTMPPGEDKGREAKTVQPPPVKDEEPASKAKEPAGKGKKKPAKPESKG